MRSLQAGTLFLLLFQLVACSEQETADTMTSDVMDTAGSPSAADTAWTDTTDPTPDTQAPAVTFVAPADGATGVAVGGGIAAIFSEAMDPSTITVESFTVHEQGTPVVGLVSYSGVTATFSPTAPLSPGTLYSAVVTTAARDLAGNPLEADFAWSFQTGTTPDATGPTVISTVPADLDMDVALNTNLSVVFDDVMDPLTVTMATFTLQSDLVQIQGTVTMTGSTAIFDPTNDLAPDTKYTATVTSGAKDLAGNPMAADTVWVFSTGDSLSDSMPVNLGTLSTFVAVAGAGLTNSNSGGVTTLNGDVALSATGSCMGDGSPCTAINPIINGTLYVNDPEGVAAAAKVDLTAAYVDAMARPVGTTVDDLAGMVLPPGVYTSDSSMSIALGGSVTLDGQGDPNAVWIFQVGSSLTVNNSAQVLLVNGAKAKNVYWAVFASSTLGSKVSFQGSILAGASNSVGTGSVVVGRLLCTTGQITLLSNTVTLPPL